MRVIVTGSTLWTDTAAIRRELTKLPAGTIVIHGDCRGVDALAGQVARELGLAVECFQKESEDYRRYGAGAWKRLNERMLESGAELVLAFHPDLHQPGKASGSQHLIGLAEASAVEVRGFTA
jgi:hypothetical protein